MLHFPQKTCVSLIQKRCVSRAMQEWAYNLSGFNKLGLHRDDLLSEQTDKDVELALKRLSPKIREERNFRLIRAMQVTLRKEILPKEEWTKLEDDKLYLTPLVEQVIKERQEQEEWNKKY